MIFAAYVLVAIVVVLFSIKCANYVDMIDRKTNISGAFIGGVILAAVTSLPELVTSISSIALGTPGLIIGNVLGSDIFNLCIFGGLILVTASGYKKAKIGSSHVKTVICTILAYLTTGAVLFFDIGSIPGVEVNVASVIIVILYAISCRFMASDEGGSEEEDDNDLTVKQVVVRFVFCALGLVVASVIITYITGIIEERYHLGQSLAGALFLGVATSIPELTSSIALVRMKNYNAMVGNVVGSNMFNYIIFSLADIIAFNANVYEVSADSRLLIIFGLISTFAALLALGLKNVKKTPKGVFALIGAVILASYMGFLVSSMNNGEQTENDLTEEVTENVSEYGGGLEGAPAGV